MKARVLFAIPILLLAMFPMASFAAPLLHSPVPQLAQLSPPDNDRDTLFDDYDPDDDNDGVADVDDPAPFDPGIPGTADPDRANPDQKPPDHDGDTLLDEYDPDDDNDGLADADDPDPFDPLVPRTQTTATVIPPVVNTPSNPTTDDPAPSGPGTAAQTASAPIVTSLPSTGSGAVSYDHAGVVISATIVVALSTTITHLWSMKR